MYDTIFTILGFILLLALPIWLVFEFVCLVFLVLFGATVTLGAIGRWISGD